jgi:hypothetical protein
LIIHETVARVLLHRDFKGVLITKTEDYDEVDY